MTVLGCVCYDEITGLDHTLPGFHPLPGSRGRKRQALPAGDRLLFLHMCMSRWHAVFLALHKLMTEIILRVLLSLHSAVSETT